MSLCHVPVSCQLSCLWTRCVFLSFAGELLPVTCLVCGPGVSLCHVQVNYHPSLVWTEITSFIKGSFAALSQRLGFLDKDSYEQLGRKQAPNFTGSRDKVCVAGFLCIHAGTCVCV